MPWSLIYAKLAFDFPLSFIWGDIIGKEDRMTPQPRPVIGIISNHYMIQDQYPVAAAGVMNSCAISEVSQAIPFIIPANLDFASAREVLAHCHGVLLTGGRPNVHPEEYGEEETPEHGSFDRERDKMALALTRECIARGQPILGICRGFQEINVAMGGTLYPEIRELPGRMNHRMPPEGSLDEKFALRHEVHFTEGGVFHTMMGLQCVMTNSLHGQGIKVPGPRIVVDGWADDETPEAIYVQDAPGFAMAVQWHPEWRAGEDAVSRPLFERFGQAALAWSQGSKHALVA